MSSTTGPVVAPFATPRLLRAALLDAAVLIATSVEGVYHRSGEFETVLQAVERYSAQSRWIADAPRRWFPPVMPRQEFLRTGYLGSFPDLVGSIDVFTGSDREHREMLTALEQDGDWAARLTPAEVVLSSSICHSLYGTLPPGIPAGGLLHECCGFAFRHEPSTDPSRMQSFRMYEFVLIGTPEQALAHRDAWVQRGLDRLEGLGLPVQAVAASDPFFGRAGRLLSASQRTAELKYELVADLHGAGPTALASSNYHLDHFGEPFGLRTPDGRTAHSACFGFGLERITLALFAVHGMDPRTWPEKVQEALRC